jgi:ABC-2 type transport system permease protein
VADQLVSGDLRGYVVIPQDFEQRLAQRGSEPLVQIVTDGSYPNTANYVENYARGVVQSWRAGLDVGAPRRPSCWSRATGSTPSWKAAAH